MASLILVGCNVSTEKKIDKLVSEEVKKALYFPNSYDHVETIVDSAFSPYDNPDYLDKMVQLVKIGTEIDECNSRIQRAKSSMSLWKNDGYGYYSSFEKNEYEEAKEEYEKELSVQSALQNKAESIANEMKEIVERGEYFIGYKVIHKYRAKNNAGQTLLSTEIFFVDKDVSKILSHYDSDTYNDIQTLLEMLEEYAKTKL